MATAAAAPSANGNGDLQALTGPRLILAGFVLALANFIVVLDTTIANVSVPHIAGGLGVSASEGTWVVTSYSVAEAVCVPLTGFLVRRFGAVRTFMAALIGFGLFSALCGLAPTLGFLIVFRLGQGFCGGPLMPLTQTLLLRIFPKHLQPAAMALWAMTTIVAPIAGPILGGWISDNWSWQWIFYINVPIIIASLTGVWMLLGPYASRGEKVYVDKVGLILLIIWVGALQMMLDNGRDDDWFASSFIVTCAVIAAIGFVAFLIWELTEKEPIVDLSVFRYRGFLFSTLTLVATFGTFFSTVVVIPQWLQQSMGYTATEAGMATALNGVLAVMMAPFVPRLMKVIDPRMLVFFGVSWLGLAAILRTQWSTDSTFWMIAFPQFMQGFGMSMFFVPLTVIGLGSVKPEDTASAAGMMSFGRTLAAAIGTAVVTTYWSDLGRADRSVLVDNLNGAETTVATLQAQGFSHQQAAGVLETLVEGQSSAMAVGHLFAVVSVVFFIAASFIWLAPRPPKDASAAGAH